MTVLDHLVGDVSTLKRTTDRLQRQQRDAMLFAIADNRLLVDLNARVDQLEAVLAEQAALALAKRPRVTRRRRRRRP